LIILILRTLLMRNTEYGMRNAEWGMGFNFSLKNGALNPAFRVLSYLYILTGKEYTQKQIH